MMSIVSFVFAFSLTVLFEGLVSKLDLLGSNYLEFVSWIYDKHPLYNFAKLCNYII